MQGKHHVKTEQRWAGCSCKPWSIKHCQLCQTPGSSKKRSYPVPESMALRTPLCQASRLRNCGRKNLWYLKPNLWYFVKASLGNEYRSSSGKPPSSRAWCLSHQLGRPTDSIGQGSAAPPSFHPTLWDQTDQLLDTHLPSGLFTQHLAQNILRGFEKCHFLLT